MAYDWDNWGDECEDDCSSGWSGGRDLAAEGGGSSTSASGTATSISTINRDVNNSKSQGVLVGDTTSACCVPQSQDQKKSSGQSKSSEDLEAARELARKVDELADKLFLELQKYLEDLVDPSVREEINKVRTIQTQQKYTT